MTVSSGWVGALENGSTTDLRLPRHDAFHYVTIKDGFGSLDEEISSRRIVIQKAEKSHLSNVGTITTLRFMHFETL